MRKWCRQGQVDAGKPPGPSTKEAIELKPLKREDPELRVPRRCCERVGFLRNRTRPATALIVRDTNEQSMSATRTPTGKVALRCRVDLRRAH